MRSFRDEEVLYRVEQLPTFKGWIDGIYDIWIRSKKDEYDRFDDKVFTYIVEDGVPKFVMACTGTSNAGSFGLMNFKLWNNRGCAVLKSDVIVYGSHAYGLHKGKPAYRQVKNFPYFRDGDRDRKAEEIGPEFSEPIGANCHRAGTMSVFINNWSVACLVRNQLAQFQRWLGYLISKGKPRLNVAILKEW
jgi:hypothetical protein